MASSTGLAIDRYSTHRYYNNKSPPASSGLMNSIFNSTVNTAAKTLISIASASRTDQNSKWGPTDHLRFMFMLMTWLTLWVLRVLMDHFPSLSASASSSSIPLPLPLHQLQAAGTGGRPSAGSRNLPPLLTSSSSSYQSVSSALSLLLPSSPALGSLDVILYEGDEEPSSVNALSRALSHILGLLNDIPASSRKYQFAMAMADRIMDENARDGHLDLLRVNRAALASAFAHTSGLLYRSLRNARDGGINNNNGAWTTAGIVRALPLGSYIAAYVNGVNLCLGAIRHYMGNSSGGGRPRRRVEVEEEEEGHEVAAEKLAQELLWITSKLRDFGAADEAMEQWSFSSGLALESLTATPRVQGFIIKIFAILFEELAKEKFRVERQVKLGLLVLWLPLCCHARNGLSYPILTRLEKVEMERAMDEVISTLPSEDQEVILTSWLQDFAITTSDWPNLQASYDRWCRCSRNLAM